MLVQIPWQQQFWLRPEALALLEAASARVGRNLYLYNDPRAAWRSYAQQASLYLNYRAGDGPVASPPDRGPRPHMRGGGFDLADTSPAVQAACRAVGLVREPSESWHWQHPATLTWPIIPTNLWIAGGTVTPIPNPDQEDKMSDFQYRQRADGKVWALLHPELPNGAITTTSLEEAKGWGPLAGNSAEVPNDRWAPMLAAAKKSADLIYGQARAANATPATPPLSTTGLATKADVDAIPAKVVAEFKLPGN